MKFFPLCMGVGAGALIILPDPNPITLCAGVIAFWIVTAIGNAMLKEDN